MNRLVGFLTGLIFVFLVLPASADETKALTAAANGQHRSAPDIERNTSRHPVETLKFFGIKKDMKVAEIWPGGGGWYTEVLAPYLRDEGKLYAVNYDGSNGSEYFAKNAKKFKAKLAAKPEVYDKVSVTNLMPPNSTPVIDEHEEVDMVLTFRNLHNWVRNGIAEEMFRQMYEILTPGGVLGLVAHRGTSEMTEKEHAMKGYLSETVAIELAEKTGFEFVGSSEVNANSKDTKDYPEGVWTLPPSYRLGDVDREKYEEIGESDRMTLKFVKFD